MNLLFLRSYHVCNELGSFSTDGCPKQRLLLISLSDRPKLFLFLKGNDFFSTANAETSVNNLHGPLRTVNCLSLAIFLFLGLHTILANLGKRKMLFCTENVYFIVDLGFSCHSRLTITDFYHSNVGHCIDHKRTNQSKGLRS